MCFASHSLPFTKYASRNFATCGAIALQCFATTFSNFGSANASGNGPSAQPATRNRSFASAMKSCPFAVGCGGAGAGSGDGGGTGALAVAASTDPDGGGVAGGGDV